MRTLAIFLVLTVSGPIGAQVKPAAPGAPGGGCTLSGTVMSGAYLLPGVALSVARPDSGVSVASSTGVDGAYSVALPGPGTYQVKAALTGFEAFNGDASVDDSCHARLDVKLTLSSRAKAAPPVQAQTPAATAPTQPASPSGSSAASPTAPGAAAPTPRTAAAPRAGLARPAPGSQSATTADPAADPTREAEFAAAQLSLPPGFSIDSSAGSVVATGSAGQINPFLVFAPMGEGGPPGMRGDMGGLGDPNGAGRVEGFPGFEGFPGAASFGGGGEGGRGGQGPGGGMGPGGGGRGEMGGRGGGPGGGRGGGPALAGRLGMAARGQNNRPRGQFTYNLSGSMLDAAPYPFRAASATKPNYLQQRFGLNVGGQLKIPGLFDAGPRTNFFLNYTGSHGSTLQDSYATVPTGAVRAGDFSSYSATLYDPSTGQPFPGNRIPDARISPASRALLAYIPEPNLDGTTRNFHYSTTTVRHQDDINFRLTHTFTTPQGGRGRAGGGGGGRGGGGRGGGQGMNLSVAIHYSRSSGEQAGVFPTTGGSNKTTGWDVPVNFNFALGGIMSAFRFQFNSRHASTFNRYAFQTDVAGNAGIQGVSEDPFSWGVPSLSFSTFTSLRDTNPSDRADRTITIGLTQTKIRGRHTVRWGGDFRTMSTDARSDSNPRGAFVFTGIYASGGAGLGTRSGLDFADFLLGEAQQATLQFGPGMTRYRAKAWSLFVQDDWRARANLTFNLGLRYEYLSPYYEANNRLVNLDVAPDFTAAVPVVAGAAGPFSGAFATSGLNPDRNNFAPRLGFAWRPDNKTTVRGGYGLSYSSPTYAGIAQKMAAQPPFAVTNSLAGTASSPLFLPTVFAVPAPVTTTNNFGIDPNYRLGHLQMWNLDVQRDLTRNISAGASYTGTRGGNLDVLRAPNRGPLGLRIPGVQPFTWETSTGHSAMNAFSVRIRKRPTGGLGGGVAYTWSKSMDDASTLGGGGGVVAQDDRNLAAEWGRSSFDQRHRLNGDLTYELPFGPNRHWLNNDGLAARILGGWTWATSVTWATGTPLTARVLGSAVDIGSGVNGSLRADYTGQPIALDDPTVLRFFNTAAFALPAPGLFGTAGRNMISGPSSLNVSMNLNKTIMIGSTRNLNVRVQASNVFNTAQFASIDTIVNSPTFGQVTSMRPMRSVQIFLRASF
jgi:hypothetical protein